MVDSNYQVIISGQDFSDVISMDDGYFWRITSFSAESSTGQDTSGNMHVPILGERVQLIFVAPPYITKKRLKELVSALKMGSKGQREVYITYDDPLFGVIKQSFYCTNVPWLKAKLPDYPHHYAGEVRIQLATTTFVKRRVLDDAPKIPVRQHVDNEYLFKINGKDFSDVVAIDGYVGQGIEQSLESQTGLNLDGTFDIPIIGSRTQIAIKGVPYLEVGRVRQLGKELGFGKIGERSHMVTYDDMVYGQTTQKFYCTEMSGYRVKLPNYPYHYIKDLEFQQAMKQFF